MPANRLLWPGSGPRQLSHHHPKPPSLAAQSPWPPQQAIHTTTASVVFEHLWTGTAIFPHTPRKTYSPRRWPSELCTSPDSMCRSGRPPTTILKSAYPILLHSCTRIRGALRSCTARLPQYAAQPISHGRRHLDTVLIGTNPLWPCCVGHSRL